MAEFNENFKYDFAGWATKNDLKCSDGRIIRHNAFKENDGKIVPLVWNHLHDEPDLVLGHALLKNTDHGVRCYGAFNDTSRGQCAKILVEHGDISALSIYANQIKQNGADVVHGMIREVSLVHAGANPGASIDTILAHSDDSDEEAIIYTGEPLTMEFAHSDEEPEEEKKETKPMADTEKTIQDVLDEMTEEQKNVVYALVGIALEESEASDEEEGDEEVKHNVFDNEEVMTSSEDYISHSDMMSVISDAKRFGSMKESAIQHGITDIEYLFPDAQNVTNTPIFIERDKGWVAKVMNGVHHTPFSRIKSLLADITPDEARAKGYVKGNEKTDEVFAALKRTTSPTTVYKKQKLERDDVVDITDFDVVAWIKSEMRGMLDEEIARAVLVGDGRQLSSNDKINEQCIRPIFNDDATYTIQAKVAVTNPSSATGEEKARAFIVAAIKARKNYKGSGNPTLFTTEDILTDMLLLTDTTGRDLYTDEAAIARKLRVKEIVTVPVMEGAKGKEGKELMGIIVNLDDYNIGADKGGAVNMFDDFDIDYNAQKYLIETRCSGALIKPFSAIALELGALVD